jgi:hypothetical protein
VFDECERGDFGDLDRLGECFKDSGGCGERDLDFGGRGERDFGFGDFLTLVDSGNMFLEYEDRGDLDRGSERFDLDFPFFVDLDLGVPSFGDLDLDFTSFGDTDPDFPFFGDFDLDFDELADLELRELDFCFRRRGLGEEPEECVRERRPKNK